MPHSSDRPRWQAVKDFAREFVDVSGDDALPFTLTDDDVRVERGEFVYYVRAVRRGKWLRQDFAPVDLLSLVLYVLLGGFVDEWRAGRPWKLGVLRRRSRGIRRVQLLHKELLPPGVRPDVRRAALVADVSSGRFDDR